MLWHLEASLRNLFVIPACTASVSSKFFAFLRKKLVYFIVVIILTVFAIKGPWVGEAGQFPF